MATATGGLAVIYLLRAEMRRNSLRYDYQQLLLKNVMDLATDQAQKSESLTRELLARLTRDERSVFAQDHAAIGSVEPATNDFRILLSEISHSLNTPLSQIDAAAITLTSNLTESSIGAEPGRDLASLERIRTSVDLCKSFLSAYAEISNLATSSLGRDELSLKTALKNAAEIYSGGIEVQIGVPDRFPGYTNSYMLAVVWPLLANALEGSDSGGRVAVLVDKERGCHLISVTNSSRVTQMDDSIYDAGFTTKENHQGVGLSGVRRILSTRRGDVSHTCVAGSVVFKITLPEVEDGR